ncbi:MAG: flagellar motor protein MotB [Gammaproteobacteria bacterium]|nr:flagellar motor protein MotB [Gammaproteobacteria bacterium]
MEDKKQPIVIKKINVIHGAHGGSWKVAFADFATAMMAFFMVLWLVGQTDAQKRGGIAEYFQNPSMVRGHSEAPTGSIGPGGAGMSLISFGTSIEMRKADPTVIEKIRDGGMAYVAYDKVIEQRRLKSLMEELRKEIGSNETFDKFKDQLLLESTPSGLRIQIVDQKNRPMFAAGSATLKYYTEELLHELAKSIDRVSNKITISGHTDASPMLKNNGSYTNWELSSDRANAARRALIAGGLKAEKIGRVIGLASTVLLDKDNPRNIINRRISIVVMKRDVSDLVKLDDEMKAVPTALLQGSRGMDDVKDNGPLPVGNDSLELQDGIRIKKIDRKQGIRIDGLSNKLDIKVKSLSELDEIDSNSNTLDLDIHGLDPKDKKPANRTKARKQVSSELDPGSQDDVVIIKKSGGRKSFISLPPIISPNIIPGIKKEKR